MRFAFLSGLLEIAVYAQAPATDPTPDFEFVVKSVRVAAGDTAWPGIELRTLGGMALEDYRNNTVTFWADDPALTLEMYQSHACPIAPSCVEGQFTGLTVHTRADLAFGAYTIHAVGRMGGKEHIASFDIIIAREVTRRKLNHEAALATLAREDTPTNPPVVVVPPSEERLRGSTFFADAELRKIHAVLVLDRSSSMITNDACRFLRVAATRFSNMFVDGRDSLGIITFSDRAELALPLTDRFQQDAPTRISTITCTGNTNTGAALEMAQRELAEHEDPEAVNVIILFTDGTPNMLDAAWPVKVGSEGLCAEASGKNQLPATLRRDFYSPGFGFRPIGTLAAPSVNNSCFVGDHLASIAHIPETDLNGVSLTGRHTLEVLKNGQNAGKARLDPRENILSAITNQVENAASQLRSGPHPAFVYTIGLTYTTGPADGPPLELLREIANDPKSASFNPKEPAGLVIMTQGPEEFLPSFLRVRQDIVKKATIH